MESFLSICLVGLNIALSLASEEEKTLIKLLLNRSLPTSRPVLRHADPINVTLRLRIDRIVDMSELREKVTLKMIYLMNWDAPALAWKPAEHGNVTQLHILPERIWIPDLVVRVNIKRDKKKSTTEGLFANTPVILYPRGHAEWDSQTMTETYCKADTIFFPFDRHLCFMNFTLWSYPSRLVTLSPGEHPAVTLLDTDHSIWNTTILRMRREDVYGIMHDEVSHQLVTGLYLERKPFFYVYNILYPGVTLILMTLLGFFIPVEGGKVTFGVSLMVTLMMFQQYLLKEAVHTSIGIPILGQIFGTGVAISVFCIVIAIVTIRLYHTGVDSKKPVNFIILRYLAKVTFLQKRMAEIEEPAVLLSSEGNAHCSDDTPDEPHGVTKHVLHHHCTRVINRPIFLQNRNMDDHIQVTSQHTPLSRKHHGIVDIYRDILTEVDELKKRFLLDKDASEKDVVCHESWVLLSEVVQRLALFLSIFVFLAACIGIFVGLATRDDIL